MAEILINGIGFGKVQRRALSTSLILGHPLNEFGSGRSWFLKGLLAAPQQHLSHENETNRPPRVAWQSQQSWPTTLLKGHVLTLTNARKHSGRQVKENSSRYGRPSGGSLSLFLITVRGWNWLRRTIPQALPYNFYSVYPIRMLRRHATRLCNIAERVCWLSRREMENRMKSTG